MKYLSGDILHPVSVEYHLLKTILIYHGQENEEDSEEILEENYKEVRTQACEKDEEDIQAQIGIRSLSNDRRSGGFLFTAALT